MIENSDCGFRCPQCGNDWQRSTDWALSMGKTGTNTCQNCGYNAIVAVNMQSSPWDSNIFEPYPLPPESEIKKPQKLDELVKELKHRFHKARIVEITEEEFLVIANASDEARKALSHMEQSELPFYSGIKALKEI